VAKWVILAGNYREFMQWCVRNQVHPKDALFVAEPANLVGRTVHDHRWVRTGTFLDRRDAQEVMELATLLRAPEPVVDTY
jgi:hypothetical protein